MFINLGPVKKRLKALEQGVTSSFVLGDGSVTTPKIVDGAVTTTKIVDEAITTTKMSPAMRRQLLNDTLIPQSEITTIGANVVINSDTTITGAMTSGTNGIIYFPADITCMQFTVGRSSGLTVACDGTNWTVIGIKSPIFKGIYNYSASSGYATYSPASDQSPAAVAGDVVRVAVDTDKYVFQIQRGGIGDFVAWFTLYKADYTAVTLWNTNPKFGFLVSSTILTGNIVASNVLMVKSAIPEMQKSITKINNQLAGMYDATISDITSVGATLTLKDGILDGTAMTSGYTYGFAYLPDNAKEVIFTVDRGSFFILGGDTSNCVAVGLKSALFKSIYTWTSAASTQVAAAVSDQSPAAVNGDVVKVRAYADKYVLQIQKGGTGDFVSWFTVYKANYPTVTQWANGERLGFITSLTIFSEGCVAKNIKLNIVPGAISGYLGSVLVSPKFTVWNTMGDSISEPGVYQAIVKAKLGITTVNNYGVSGTYVSKRDESDTTAMCTRISSMAGGADLNTVYGGINDFIGSYGGGDLGDISSTALTTFYGALKSIAVYLLTNYPTATNVFITPIKCGGYVSGVTGLTWYYDTPNAGGHVLADYANAIKEVGAKYSIPVLDLFSLSGIETTNINYMTSDKLHPGTIGYQRIATLMANFFSSLG